MLEASLLGDLRWHGDVVSTVWNRLELGAKPSHSRDRITPPVAPRRRFAAALLAPRRRFAAALWGLRAARLRGAVAHDQTAEPTPAASSAEQIGLRNRHGVGRVAAGATGAARAVAARTGTAGRDGVAASAAVHLERRARRGQRPRVDSNRA